MMTKTWNFVTKKIADGVNQFLSFFCLILIWYVCIIFSKISLATSHGRFRLGSTSLLEIHHVEKSTKQGWAFTLSTVSWFSEQHKSKTPGLSVRQCSWDVSLGNECKNKLQTHKQVPLYDTYFKHGIGWQTTQYGKGYCQRYDDFQGNEGHFIGDWLNIVYFSNTPRKLSRFPNEPFVHARFIQLQFSFVFYFKLPSHNLSAPYAPWQWHITL